ncbi:MAG TPA: hypothetical protein VLC92_04630 [Rhodocyclaceae bacterium]|nr:hypothetical protein [Rhodocyclaceae bacterium]
MMYKLTAGLIACMLIGGAHAATDYPAGYTKCAQIGGTCSMTGTRQTALGKAGSFVYATKTGSFACTNAAYPSNSYPTSAWCSYAGTTTSSSSSTAASSVASSSSSKSSSTSSVASSVASSVSSSVSSANQGNAAGVIGFASLNKAGRNGTNGGAGGSTVTVTTYAALVAAVGDNTPRTVLVSGTISGAGPMIRVGSNKTIQGVGATATISGFGFNVSGFIPPNEGDSCDLADKGTFTPAENVIIRNLSFKNSSDDSVNVQRYSHHVWVDHNTFYVSYDGSVDVKRGADWVTVSWNRYIGTDKSMLLGHSDDNGAQDRGYLHASYHHNWFDHSNTRHPRVRFGQAHVFNNYGNGITDYFVGAGTECDITAEGNYTDAIKRLITYWSGVKVTWNSTNVQETPPHADDGLVQNGQGFNPKTYYSYTLDPAASIPTIVKNGAGVGKI